MALIACTPHVCSGSVHAGDPEVFSRRNVLYVPKTNRHPDIGFGLFDEAGRQILSNALFHGTPPYLKSQSLSTPIDTSQDHPEITTAIYGGAISLHYGHFITECLNTLWYYIRHGSPMDKVVFHSSLSLTEILETPWLSDLLRFAGLRPDQIIIPDQPTVFRRLIVPGQAFSEDAFVYEGFADICAMVGDAANAETTFQSSAAPFYLSRLKVQSGTIQIVNEDELVNELARAGVLPVDPQEFCVADQIAFFRNERPVTGIIGSAFHTSIFTRNPHAVALSPSHQVRRSYPLMDAAHPARITYLFADDLTQTEAPSHFGMHFRLADPRQAAQDMLRALDNEAQTGRRNISPHPFLAQERAACDLPGFSAFTLLTYENQPVMMDRWSGQVYGTDGHETGMTPITALRRNHCIFLVADTNNAPCLMIRNDPLVAPVLPYLLVPSEEGLALVNPQTGLYLTTPPARTGVAAACDTSKIGGWECYTLLPCEFPKLPEHVSEMLAAAAGVLESGATDRGASNSTLEESAFLERVRQCLEQPCKAR